jgi:hypothetical protein
MHKPMFLVIFYSLIKCDDERPRLFKTIADHNQHRLGNIVTLSCYKMMTLRHTVRATRLNKLLNKALAAGAIQGKIGQRKQSAAHVHTI